MVRYARFPGDPLYPEGLASNSVVLLRVPEADELARLAMKVHRDYGHATVGSTVRQMTHCFWHPELVLAAQQAVIECSDCQLMKKLNPALPDFNPITPPPPLMRWAIDFTFVDSVPILVAVEYVTGWVLAQVIPD